MSLEDVRIGTIDPLTPVTAPAVLRRLRLTVVAATTGLLGVPALLVWIVWLVGLPLMVVTVGFVLLAVAVPSARVLARPTRVLSGAVLGERLGELHPGPTRSPLRSLAWMREQAHWRDFAFLAFASTGGLVMSAIPVLLLASPLTYLVLALTTREAVWWVLLVLGGLELALWWLLTPVLVRARSVCDRAILSGTRVERLERRVEQVTTAREASVDHSAAEVRRIERDLHDGAQARLVALGMSLGMAEQTVRDDPERAAALLREARETTVSALADLRSVVHGIHPPVLADRGLVGAVQALAVDLPVPVMVTVGFRDRLPEPVESALYFAVAECLTNTAKHAHAARAWVSLDRAGDLVRVECGDDGRGGADVTSSGLAGVARRLAAFDGTLVVDSPRGGPTVVVMEVPCRTVPG